ncbi:MFS transporter [Actinomadura vinacea]|uniref:MFS transporter n=1 Tax=Actinomadura vinacea TaxID=115336 RepID=A0ABN3JYU0_9ACTN
MTGRWERRHFHGIGYVLIILLVGANMPSPLYGTYRAEFGFSPLVQTLVFAVYAAALVPALLVFGPLSDTAGRRPVLALALLFGAAGAVLMACADSTAWLFAGRVAQGLSVGACSAAGAAALVEHEPHGDHRRAGIAASAATAGGAALGPLFAGVVAESRPGGLVLPYLLYLGALLPAGAALALLPVRREPGARDRLRIRPPRVPRPARAVFASAVATTAAGWGAVGLFQAVVPSWITGLLGAGNLLVGAAAACLVMLASTTTQLLARGAPHRAAQRAGLAFLLAGMIGLPAVALVESIPLLLLITAVVGCGHGLTFSGGIQEINALVAGAAPDARGAVLAAFYTISYAGLVLPSVGAGLLITYQGMTAAVNEFSLAAGLMCALILALNLRLERSLP